MDYLVIGAGPAGLQLGYFLERAGHDYLILDAGASPGTFFRTFPRHHRLISINKPHTGWDDPELSLRMDWNSLLSDHLDGKEGEFEIRQPFELEDFALSKAVERFRERVGRLPVRRAPRLCNVRPFTRRLRSRRRGAP